VQAQSTEMLARAREIIQPMLAVEGPLLPVLHALQDEFGHVPPETMPLIADVLNISRAEVHGVVTFYHDYRREPAGRHVLKLCQAEACQSMGSERVAARLKQLLGIDFHQTSADGSVTLEPVYCLGLCACAPSAMLDGTVYGRMDEETIGEIAEAARA